MCSKSANVGPARGSSAGPSPSQGRRLTISSFTAPFDSFSSPSSRAVAECQMMPTVKIATATMSREISLVNDCDGVTKEELRLRGFTADPSESLCHFVTSPFGKGGQFIGGWRRENPAYGTSIGTPPPLTRSPSPLKRGGLGAFAASPLMNSYQLYPPNGSIDSIRGPFPGKGLPTGLGLADGK